MIKSLLYSFHLGPIPMRCLSCRFEILSLYIINISTLSLAFICLGVIMVLSMHPSRDVVLSFFNSIAGRAAVAIHVDVHSFMTLS